MANRKMNFAYLESLGKVESGSPCPVCKQIFKKKYMREHMKRAHKDVKYKCMDCIETFSTKEALQRHKLEQHFKSELYRCHCGSIFKTKWKLNDHQLVHESRKMTCEVCDRKFANLLSLRRHHRDQHLKTHGPIQIEVIPKTPKVLNHHKKFVCDKCGAILKTRDLFINHFRSQHSIKPQLFCGLCPKSFERKSLLEKHMQDHFDVNPITRKSCEQTAKDDQTIVANFEKQMLQHEPGKECKICHEKAAKVFMKIRDQIKKLRHKTVET